MPDDGECGVRRKERYRTFNLAKKVTWHALISQKRILGVLREWVDLQPEHFYGEGLDDFKDFMHIVLLETGNVTAKAICKKISKIDVDPLVYYIPSSTSLPIISFSGLCTQATRG